MRIISLNIWGGKVFEPLLKFIKEESERADIFCFQEVPFLKEGHSAIKGPKEEIFSEIRNALSDFNFFQAFAPEEAMFELKRLPEHLLIGLSMFVRKKFDVMDSGEFITYDPGSELFLREGVHNCGAFEYVKIKDGGRELLVGNLHGLWQSDGKGDSPDRNYQTKKVLDFFAGHECGKILIGDFNIRPESAGIRTFGGHFLNLIEKNKILKTRTELYKDMEKYGDYISDYAFVSADVPVKSFMAPKDVIVSDHLPLILEI